MIDTGNDVNAEEEGFIATCTKTLKCGHKCNGVKGERNCPPCLHTDCAGKHYNGDINADELCGICFTSELGAEACTKLSCGHVFHTGCLIQLLKHGWNSLRITFGFMSCPSCKQEIDIRGVSKPIARELGPLIALKKHVEAEALKNAEEQGILHDERLTTPGDAYYNNPQEFANHRTSFY